MRLRDLCSTLAGWQECSLAEYSHAYKQYGGSNCTHPALLDFLQSTTPEHYRFFSKVKKGETTAAIFINSAGEFCLPGKYNQLVSEDEIIFPAKPSAKIILPYASKTLSPLHQHHLINRLHPCFNKRQVCLIRTDLSAKTKKNRRNELNRFIKQGGEIVPVAEYSTQEICDIYNTLFEKRWRRPIETENLVLLEQFLRKHPEMIFGNVLTINGAPCAYDLIVKSESPAWIYFDIPNGGFDMLYSDLSVGSILMWINTQQALSLCESKGKTMRFSLGKPSMDYKKRWCDVHRLLRTA